MPSQRVSLKETGVLTYLKRYGVLYLLLLPPMVFFLVFRYAPMVNILIAFKQNNFLKPVWEVPWAANHGFEWFIKAFQNADFLYTLRNTVMLNLLGLVMGFPAPIILAILLNELRFKTFKRVTQTVAYMPHFLSWIIISSLALRLFAPNPPTQGLVNIVLGRMGMEPIHFLVEPVHWVFTYIGLGIWQSVGWNTIIYLAAITSINPELYEAATVDGADRFQKIRHITLPGISGTIVIMLVLAVGGLMNNGFEQIYLFQNDMNISVSDIFETYTYSIGIVGGQYSYSTAVGLFKNVVGTILIFSSNTLAKRLGGSTLY